jgi:CheY-like chemotaxis protein
MTDSPLAPILVVEDDDDSRTLLEQLLAAQGYEVHSAQNGQEALDHLRRLRQPCLILLDLMMPVMDGWQFLSAFKRERLAPGSAVIVLSAIADKRSAQEHPYMQKPADFARLLELVREYCPSKGAA